MHELLSPRMTTEEIEVRYQALIPEMRETCVKVLDLLTRWKR
jgi:hypothetical protein